MGCGFDQVLSCSPIIFLDGKIMARYKVKCDNCKVFVSNSESRVCCGKRCCKDTEACEERRKRK